MDFILRDMIYTHFLPKNGRATDVAFAIVISLPLYSSLSKGDSSSELFHDYSVDRCIYRTLIPVDIIPGNSITILHDLERLSNL